jgi:hypothetical protein
VITAASLVNRPGAKFFPGGWGSKRNSDVSPLLRLSLSARTGKNGAMAKTTAKAVKTTNAVKTNAPLSNGKEGSSSEGLVAVLEKRFRQHPERHPGVAWEDVVRKLKPKLLKTLDAMEASGGEPDVVLLCEDELAFVDCSAESPTGRRSLCFDRAAWEKRKEARPSGNALDLVKEWGAELLDEADYRALQSYGAFDTKTSSWIVTPPAIRSKGGALFGDRRYDHVFVYHNGAESYYAARGFRVKVRIE